MKDISTPRYSVWDFSFNKLHIVLANRRQKSQDQDRIRGRVNLILPALRVAVGGRAAPTQTSLQRQSFGSRQISPKRISFQRYGS